MNNLQKRLQVIYDLVPVGSTVADIGTDHAYLPIALIKGQKAKRVIACDINASPLALAKANIEKSNCTSIQLRLCDGLAGLNKGEADTVIIAGMGGEVISGILSRCDHIKDSSVLLLLQPMTAASHLRDFLSQNGFSILSETALCERGKIYTVMSVRYTGDRSSHNEAYFFIGNMTGKTESEKLYINKQLRIIDDVINDISARPQLKDKLDFYKKAKKQIKELSEN